MNKKITIKDINYRRNNLNNLTKAYEDKKLTSKKLIKVSKNDIVNAIQVNDSVTYQFVTKVRDKFITIGLAGLIFTCGYYVGNKLERNDFQKRAVEAGVGEYIIVDPYTGESQFEFVNPLEISRAFGMIE